MPFASPRTSLDLNIQDLRTQLPFIEVRSGLFGYFHGAGNLAPESVIAAAPEISAPFYIVFYDDGRDAVSPEGRLVTITEHEIAIQ